MTTGTWAVSAWVYVPTDFDGAGIGVVSESPVASALDSEVFLAADGSIDEFIFSFDGQFVINSLPLIRGAWTEVSTIIDLDANTFSVDYSGFPLFSGEYDSGNDGASLAGVNFWVQGTSGAIYYDDFSVTPVPESQDWSSPRLDFWDCGIESVARNVDVSRSFVPATYLLDL